MCVLNNLVFLVGGLYAHELTDTGGKQIHTYNGYATAKNKFGSVLLAHLQKLGTVNFYLDIRMVVSLMFIKQETF